MSPRKSVYCIFTLRPIEKTGDSSTSLRMTGFAITIRETRRSHLRQHCHPEEALSAVPGTGRRQADEGSAAASIHPCATCTCTDRKGGTSGTAPLPASGRGRGRGRHADEAKGPTTSPRKCVYRVFGVKDKREDGRFFDCAQNDMSCNNHWRNLSVRSRHKLSS